MAINFIIDPFYSKINLHRQFRVFKMNNKPICGYFKYNFNAGNLHAKIKLASVLSEKRARYDGLSFL
jgi:hypothetical protein